MLVSIAIIVIGTELAALATILLRNYRTSRFNEYHKTPMAGDVFGVVGTGFAVILAFVIFTTIDSYQRARADIGTETVATQQMYSLARYFSPASRETLQGDLVCYTRAVVSDEWPAMAMATGQRSLLVDAWVDQLDQDMLATPVETNKEIEVFNTWFARSAERQDGRRGRLAEAAPYVPPFVWAMLTLLFVVVVGYQVLFVRPGLPLLPQLAGVSAVAATMLAGIVIVYVLDAPFSDRGAGVSTVRVQQSLDIMESQLPVTSVLPCDASGRPNR